MPKRNGAPPPHRPVVLVVDDMLDVRTSLRALLEQYHFLVLEASNSSRALDTLKTQRVDAILTDLYMPGEIDGVALCQRIADMRGPRPAIIAMSGAPHLAYRSSLQAAKYLGADATLTKPFAADELVSTIDRLIGREPALATNGRPSR